MSIKWEDGPYPYLSHQLVLFKNIGAGEPIRIFSMLLSRIVECEFNKEKHINYAACFGKTDISIFLAEGEFESVSEICDHYEALKDVVIEFAK